MQNQFHHTLFFFTAFILLQEPAYHFLQIEHNAQFSEQPPDCTLKISLFSRSFLNLVVFALFYSDIYFFSIERQSIEKIFFHQFVHSMLDKQTEFQICSRTRTFVFKSLASKFNYFSVNLCHFHNLLSAFQKFIDQLSFFG